MNEWRGSRRKERILIITSNLFQGVTFSDLHRMDITTNKYKEWHGMKPSWWKRYALLHLFYISNQSTTIDIRFLQFSLYSSSCHLFFNFFFRFRVSKWNVNFTLGRLKALESHAFLPAFAFMVCFVGGERKERE